MRSTSVRTGREQQWVGQLERAPACVLAAAWILMPDDAAGLFHETYQPRPDTAILLCARG
ncbi:hypothetical protein [Streptomyces chartreusis]|uniref:hypothetical protein n=1 Tax=Streptomyces chartreusis TaxID=1969 RepID=UPI0035E1FBFC